MTKKNYIALAKAIYDVKPYSITNDHSEGISDGIRLVEESIADALSADNPLFDREKFLNACRGR